MKLTFFNEAEKIWSRISKGTGSADYQFSLQIHKKLLSLFQVGDYYYYLFNVKHSVFELVSPEITPVLGYLPEEVDVPFFLGNIHPDDQPWFLNFENKVTEFFSTLHPEQIPDYKVRYDYGVRKKSGDYIRILQQVITVDFEDKAVIRTLGIHTDISHLKQEGRPVLSFIGLNGQPSYVDVQAKNVYSEEPALSRREQEILALIVDGKTSEEIGKLLFISPLTVQVHRKNILRKTGCMNPATLISYAITKGLV